MIRYILTILERQFDLFINMANSRVHVSIIRDLIIYFFFRLFFFVAMKGEKKNKQLSKKL